jgi:hypothetical protein
MASYDVNHHRSAHRLRDIANQMQRAICAVELAVDALSPRDRLIVLNEALRNALDDRAMREPKKTDGGFPHRRLA